jgi:esterase/lipase superfamily enzyme
MWCGQQSRNVIREYYKTDSKALGREMEMLVFGHAGLPVLPFQPLPGAFFRWKTSG